MLVQAHKTKLVKPADDLFQVVVDAIPSINDGTVLVMASKLFSYAQNRLVAKPNDEHQALQLKHELVRQEADLYLEPNASKYDVMITVTNQTVAVSAGIDESNSFGDNFILWPKNLQAEVDRLWQKLKAHYGIKNFGVIVTDSKTMPLRWGVVGTTLCHCGFEALYSYIGKGDLFGRKMIMSQINVAEAVGVAATLEMGEGDERTPLATVEKISKISFQDSPPSKEELQQAVIDPDDDVYAPLLKSVAWLSKK